jgi:hypothetical protein
MRYLWYVKQRAPIVGLAQRKNRTALPRNLKYQFALFAMIENFQFDQVRFLVLGNFVHEIFLEISLLYCEVRTGL